MISHTHWDREWYQCFEEFRLRLVDLIDHLLEIYDKHPNYVFYLDAQTICLEDYLEIRPHRRGRLRELIASGNLLVGPWYVQNDFHLTSGESTVRNLLIGSAIASEFGRCEMVGYAPDQFGLISQLPQILKRFGVQNAVFGRGFNFYQQGEDGAPVRESRPAEFEWISPDGSGVFSIHLSKWYNNAQRFSEDPERALRYLQHVDKELEPFCTTPFRLLMNGVDHLEAQGNLLPILSRLQQDMEGAAEISQSTLQAYIDRVSGYLSDRAVPAVHGELRYGIDLDLLQGTLSSRRYLKALNSRCQTLLELELEPLYAALAVSTGGAQSYPADMMLYLWKELIKNHPHDSICGCSVDRVHQDNENRFLRVIDGGEDLKQRGIQGLLDRISRDGMAADHYLLAVVNPLPHTRSEVVTAQVRLPLDEKVSGFRLTAPNGESVPYHVVESKKHNRMTLSPFNLPGQLAVEELTIRFYAAEVPASGYAVYRLEPDSNAPAACQAEIGTGCRIENEFLRLSVQPTGRVDLEDLQSGKVIESVLSFEDTTDLGDSYCCIPGDAFDLSGAEPVVTLEEENDLCQSLRLDYSLMLPESLDRKRGIRTGSVENRVSLLLTLRRGSPVLDLNAEIENASSDHRLRMLVHSGVNADSSLCAQPFDVVVRPRYPEQEWLNTDKCQPVSDWVSVKDSEAQISVLTDGVYDYEYLRDERHSLAFTCVRATGRITNDLFGEDGNGVEQAPEWAAPENQCLRSTPFHIGIRVGQASSAELFREKQCWVSSLLYGFDSADHHKFLNGRPCVQSADLSEMFFRDLPAEQVCLPLQSSSVELRGDGVFSAFKQAEDRRGLILRLFNPSDEPVSVDLGNVTGWREVMLDETPQEAWQSAEIPPVLTPKQILSLELKFG
ncbi:glycoside hydrolase family 38 N-terminal domain-containing protein [Tichowtungia aerotolerans]|uniref:Glycoside hydrolase family 38 central domain-containing protein n=1 Tax=Tichowtungia aerotolerans TaxID=2697043 RepID=A0A6P1M4S4_9BACT|nr:glycoside hydrolase family 38 C-terminal domain-containing protein [Tichowtungia aerotolerans]QHI68003.1 hypothetical protein GT409_00570 [Tichowtungia aerotolerans]